MYDDMYSDKEPVFARALELLPHDIRVARYRRLMRGANLNHLRMYLPVHGMSFLSRDDHLLGRSLVCCLESARPLVSV